MNVICHRHIHLIQVSPKGTFQHKIQKITENIGSLYSQGIKDISF